MQLTHSDRQTSHQVGLESERRFWIGVFTAYVIVLATISGLAYLRLIPGNLTAMPYFDKGAHFLLLGGASYLSHRALGGRAFEMAGVSIPIGPLCFAVFSMVDECIQAAVPWRTFSLLDLAANLAGVIVFGWLAVRTVGAHVQRPGL